jgi:hypothetical protein
MNLLPSISIFSVPEHQEYTCIMVTCLDRVAQTEEGHVLEYWEKVFYVKEDITAVDEGKAAAMIAKMLNTISEQLEADDYETYELVTKETAHGRPYVM